MGRATLARVPRAAVVCALVASLNAICWSMLTPPFEGVDEPSHFAYVQELVQGGRLPQTGPSTYSAEESVILRDLHLLAVRWHPQVHPIDSPAEQRRLHADLSLALSRRGGGGAGVSSSEPPLYYALEAVPYGLGLTGNLLDQLALMRFLSALMAGLTGFFTFMFLREALPGARWAWTVGGLSASAMPLLGYMSGIVNPDAMLFAVSAAMFYCLARAFRRGLTSSTAVALGALSATGLLTKLNFIGLIPGVLLGLLVLTVRGSRSAGARTAQRSLAIALTVGAVPVGVYLLLSAVSGHGGPGIVSTTGSELIGHRSLSGEIGYIWQFYLPSLPGMPASSFPGISTAREWFDRFVGLYGWVDTSFPVWVENLALLPAGAILLLLARALLGARAALRARAAELAVYLAMACGLMVLVAAGGYANLGVEGSSYVEPRYLLPLLPLAAAALALAARAGGRRYGPALGALIVVGFLAHDIFSQLLVVARYYS